MTGIRRGRSFDILRLTSKEHVNWPAECSPKAGKMCQVRIEQDRYTNNLKIRVVQVIIHALLLCSTLVGLRERELYDLNKCSYDLGGYFIINGSEKVLIAQERMATNHVYVFAKAQPSPINFLAEIRSAVEKGGKTISQFQVKMFHRNQEKTVSSGRT